MTKTALDPVGRPQATGRPIPGEASAWVFLIAEMTVFSALFAVIAWHQKTYPDVFEQSQMLLTQPLGLINTIVLIIGSILVVLAVQAVNESRFAAASGLLSGAMASGVVFALIKATEYGLLLHHGAWIHTNVFWMLFFAITGAHLLHVFVGVTVLGLARRRVVARLNGARDRDLFISATCYWHLVDLLWLVLFPLFYLVN